MVIQEFFTGMGSVGQGNSLLIRHRRYRTPHQRQRALQDALNMAPLSPFDTISSELNALILQPFFNQFDHTANLETVDFGHAFTILQETAPNWHDLLSRLLSNQRAHWRSYNTSQDDVALAKRMFTITSIICHSRARTRSHFFPSVLDIYLIGSGTKRRVIETLSGLGLCHSYTRANQLMGKIASDARVC